ncbi:HupE/UreJ family protein [Pseudomaricurvus alkylphenolicus]|jgi:hypothetical protein|uniref:HupE/UreJ family protein n=1 Tax=Pseudomaricurvus alkylphenolicus TaxID=1306991 RepID=UPI0014249016|nr:HupE/UreJ family protein [Pseudomaricurvus alkylphenolicus]NIB43367.1 HupE/UreJ family protein [Pseudomaricurvus alkylphenolicus]
MLSLKVKLLLILFLLGPVSVVQAHNRSESFTDWSVQGNQLSFSFSVLQREATRIPADTDAYQQLGPLLAEYLQEQLRVQVNGRYCKPLQVPQALPSREGFLRVEGSFSCPDSSTPVLEINSFFDLIATHTHYARVRQGGVVTEWLFTQSQRTHSLSVETDAQEVTDWQAFGQYLWIGGEHILGGIDHLAFVLALILLAHHWRAMAWLITGFTLGHSLSLALAVLGIAEPNSLMVEALIGFTIALVVIEALGERSETLWSLATWLPALCLILVLPLWLVSHQWLLMVGVAGVGLFALCYLRIVAVSSRASAWRLLVTTVFGLIHGFGFAGGLLETGFPPGQLAFVLMGFNLGVELGQLLVLAAILILMALGRRFLAEPTRQLGFNLTASMLSGLGTFWFVSRLMA